MFCTFCQAEHSGPHIHDPKRSNRYIRALITDSITDGIIISGLVFMAAATLYNLALWFR